MRRCGEREVGVPARPCRGPAAEGPWASAGGAPAVPTQGSRRRPQRAACAEGLLPFPLSWSEGGARLAPSGSQFEATRTWEWLRRSEESPVRGTEDPARSPTSQGPPSLSPHPGPNISNPEARDRVWGPGHCLTSRSLTPEEDPCLRVWLTCGSPWAPFPARWTEACPSGLPGPAVAPVTLVFEILSVLYSFSSSTC